MEYVTCTKCKKQQARSNFKYGKAMHSVCKYCSKKTNVIPNDYLSTASDVSKYLNDIIFNTKLNIPIQLELQMGPVFTFLKRQADKDTERTEELMLKAFKLGQEKTGMEDYPIKLWIKEQLWKINQ